MSDTVTIAVLLGTTRPGAESRKVAKLVERVGREQDGVEIIFVDPAELKLPQDGDDIKDPFYTETTAKADGFFIVTPEYNHSFPGSLKRMLDSEEDNYYRKAVAFAGVSSGRFGGVRALASLSITTRRLGLLAVKWDVQVWDVKTRFGEMDEIQDEELEGKIKEVFSDLIWLARALKEARAQGSK